jgi:nitroreductase
MDFFTAVLKRRSVRKYKPRPVPPVKLKKLLAAVKAAPSAGDLQSYDVVVVTKEAGKKSLATATTYKQSFIADAPAVLVFFANPAVSATKFGRRGVEMYSMQDATIACAYAQLAATALGLSSVWVGAFEPGLVRTALRAHSNATPVAMLPIGFGAERPRAQPRVSRVVKESF